MPCWRSSSARMRSTKFTKHSPEDFPELHIACPTQRPAGMECERVHMSEMWR